MPIKSLLAVVLLGALGRAQDTDAVALTRAIAIEELEHDIAGATQRYQDLHQNAPTDAVRHAAGLRLAQTLRVQRRDAEAIAVLQGLAAGQGPHAETAKRLLQDPQDAGRFAEHIQACIAKIRSGNPEATQQLDWMGELAVPHLIRAIEQETNDLTFVSVAMAVLVTTGGQTVAAWLQRVVSSSDTVLKRTLIGTLKQTSRVAADARAIAAGLFRDAEPTIRAEALRQLAQQFATRDWVSLLSDADPGVRQTALASARNTLRGAMVAPDKATIDLLVPHLERAAQARDAVALDALSESAAVTLLQTWTGRESYIKLLAMPEFVPPQQMRWSQGEVGPTEHLATLLATARQLGPIQPAGGEGNAERRQQAIADLLRFIAPTWSREALPAALEFVALGYDQANVPLSDLVRRGGTAAIANEVTAHFERFSKPHTIAQWLLEVGITGVDQAPLRQWIAAQLDNQTDYGREARRLLAHILAQHGDAESRAFLESFALDRKHDWLAWSLLHHDTPAAFESAKRMIALDGLLPGVRDACFRRILQAGARDCEGLLAKAYTQGLAGSEAAPQDRGLAWLLDDEIGQAVDTPTLTKLVERCAATGHPHVWQDLARFTNAGESRQLPDSAWGAALQHVSTCPERDNAGAELRLSMLHLLVVKLDIVPDGRKVLLREIAAAKRAALSALQWRGTIDQELADAAVPHLANADRNVVLGATWGLNQVGLRHHAERFLPLLTHADAEVRAEAARTMLKLDPNLAGTRLAPLARDVQPSNRQLFCTLAQGSLSREVVPELLRLLRDSEEAVRTAAAEALKAIDFYETQAARWQRLMTAGGLDATSAAEALVRKAREGAKATRIAAIASLGTLAVPETLPFLLELSEDADPEVSTAARAALDKINAKK